ncbi:uncharacterized protein N7482_007939 [Penicillium canariense]|uniref:Uncharacterized protein n=1 Tax=Penicillium canariense TaxID=189055 RepID=A0A9W9I0Q1_9EURO|nr:uncharacterized protein N7482_007939 [Penicillium canariense]KAJ5160935.1 hypothetical protein N7482_007939 [Penicillium canariense]
MTNDRSLGPRASSCEETSISKTIPITIQDAFHQRVLEQHDAPAVCAWDGELTYGELDEKSSALARLLAQKGVQAGVFVPLCFDRSLWTAVAMLAVSKAGGVFCFLEPKYPLARLQHMCRHINSKMVLASESQLELATKLSEHSLVLAVNESLLSTSPTDQELGDTVPDQAAYVAFTSGSTGKPKGIVVSHQALVAGILHNHKPLHLNRRSRVLHFASFAFDVSFLEHFWPLLVGGCLCIPSESDRENNLMETIQKLQVNWAFFTPSVARVLNPTQLPTLRHLILGGEPVTQTDLDMWSPHVQIIGVYGPAECAGCITVQSDYGKVVSAANIGFPYAVACWVVDENDHTVLVPTGSVGELVIKGPSLSEGYIHDPEQTAKSYISNPPWLSVSNEVEEKLYKTGDLVRCLPDGSFHFIGRKDTQVKINGQRIELQEVEHHTRAVLGSNREVIVEAVTAGRPSSSLVAFIVTENVPHSSTELFLAPEAGFQDRINTTRSLLRGRLPGYMIPETYISISRIPSTVTGKVDRKGLREQFTLLPRAQIKAYFGLENKEKAMPLTATEVQMQRLWANVLNLDLHEVSRHDDWISLGQFFLTVPEIFRHKTIATLCQNIKTDVSEMMQEINPFALLYDHQLKGDTLLRTIADQCQVSQDSIEDAYPCTSLQLDASLVPIQLGYNYTLRLEFQLPSAVDPAQLALAWEMTVAANPILRTRIVELTKDRYIQAVIRETIPLDTLHRSTMPQYEPSVDVWGLGKRLVRVCVQTNRLVMLIHHAIYDGQSLPLLFRDISSAYQGQKLTLRHFAPFVRWSTNISAPQRQFWIEKFAEFDGRVFPPVLDPSLEPVESRELTGTLNIINDDFTATNKIRLAFAIVTSWYLGTDDVVFGAVFARRSAPIMDIIDSAVPTTAMLPDRIQLDPKETLRYNLERDQDNVLSLISNEGIDDRDIEQLSPECAAACQYGTLLAVQPDLTTAYPEMFREKDMQYYGPICALNALLQCYLSPGSATISLRLSETTMQGVYCWEQFMDEFQAVFHLIQQRPEVKLCDLRSQLDISTSRSFLP